MRKTAGDAPQYAHTKSKAINLILPLELLEEIDNAARANYASRSGFIRESVVMRLKGQYITGQDEESGTETFY